MIDVKVAVGVGYEFAIVSGNLIKDIKLNRTETLVSVDDEVYPLYKGETYDDSRKIDDILDGPTEPKIYKILEHVAKKLKSQNRSSLG